jgi:trehalose 6-phosphate phosphatase
VLLCARELVAQHHGLLLEAKPGGFALHYRQRPELAAQCQASLQVAMAACPAPALGWELMQGHCVLELKLQAVSKGTALRSLYAEPEFAGRLPVFVGDDLTDEYGIEAAQALGGYGVRVGPGDSQARFRLANIDAVAQWLGASAHSLATGHPGEPPHA